MAKILENLKVEWDHIIEELNLQNQIRVEISNNVTFNASARKNKDNTYLITIDKEIYGTVTKFYHGLLIKENKDIVNLLRYKSSEESDDEYLDEKDLEILSDLYVYLTMKFIFLHEFGHIINGHIGYYSSINKESSLELNLNEDNLKAFNGLTAHEYQMLEINADAFAITNLMIGMYNDLQIQFSYLERYKRVIKDWNHLILMTTNAIVLSMLLGGMGRVKKEVKLTESKYIPNGSRTIEILKGMEKHSGVIVKEYDNMTKLFIEVIDFLHVLVKKYFIKQGSWGESSFIDKSIISQDMEEKLNKHKEMLYEDIWPKLKTKVTKFAYVSENHLGD